MMGFSKGPSQARQQQVGITGAAKPALGKVEAVDTQTTAPGATNKGFRGTGGQGAEYLTFWWHDPLHYTVLLHTVFYTFYCITL